MYTDKQLLTIAMAPTFVSVKKRQGGQLSQSISPGFVIDVSDRCGISTKSSLPLRGSRSRVTFLLGSGAALSFIVRFLQLFVPGHLDQLLEVIPHILGVVQEEVLFHLPLRALLPSHRRWISQLPLLLPRFLNKMGAN